MSIALEKNSEIELDIEDMSNFGCGVGKYDGAVVFVRGAVAGDKIRAKIIKTSASYGVGRIIEIMKPSPRRTADFCPAPHNCGGCAYRNIDYGFELVLKKNEVANAFKKEGISDVVTEDVRTTNIVSRYRNKEQFPVGNMFVNGKPRLTAGVYEQRTHRIVETFDCRLCPAVFGQIAEYICKILTDEGVTAYDETANSGLIRHIYLRYGEATGEIMVCLVINGDGIENIGRVRDALLKKFPEISGICLNINKKKTNVILGDKFVNIYGNGYINDEIRGLKVRITPDAFYQVNRKAAELLYATAEELALKHKNGNLLDLYCGIGTIGLCMAKHFKNVFGTEVVPSAVACAEKNAAINNIDNAFFCVGDLGKTADIPRLAREPIDVAVIDPPRKGTNSELIKRIGEMNIEDVIYVSCECSTLARDCVAFRKNGYEVKRIIPVDMFPRCGHVETVVLLSHKKAGQLYQH